MGTQTPQCTNMDNTKEGGTKRTSNNHSGERKQRRTTPQTHTERTRQHNTRKANNQPPTNTANTVTKNTNTTTTPVSHADTTNNLHTQQEYHGNRRQRRTVPLLMVTHNRKWIDSL